MTKGMSRRKGEKMKGRHEARTNTDSHITASPSKTRARHAKAQRGDGIYRGVTASPGPSSSCAPGNLSASGRMSRGPCCLAPQRPNLDNVEDFTLLG